MIAGLQSAIWLMRLFVTDSTVCLLPLELLSGLDRDWRAVRDFMCQDERHLKQTVIILAHLNVKLDHFFKKWPCHKAQQQRITLVYRACNRCVINIC